MKIAAAILVITVAFGAQPCAAHGTPILQSGGAGQRVIAGGNASCKIERGVHVCGAAISAQPIETVLSGREATVRQRIITERIIINRPYRRVRNLRVQGFTNGKVYPSKRFTQGFFADRTARRR